MPSVLLCTHAVGQLKPNFKIYGSGSCGQTKDWYAINEKEYILIVILQTIQRNEMTPPVILLLHLGFALLSAYVEEYDRYSLI